jgi:hypothetical protein
MSVPSLALVGLRRASLAISIIICVGLLTLPDVLRADCTPPPPGLVAWWPGDGNANDIIGANHGTLVGNATAIGIGIVGQAFSLDGVNAAVTAGTNSFFDFGGGSADFSIEAWVKPAVLPSFSTGFASKSAGDFDGWVFGMFSDGTLLFSGAGNWYVGSGPRVVVPGVWSHVAVTHAGGAYTLYCNGSYVGSGSGGAWTGSAAPLGLGVNPPRQNYNGLLDEVGIYSRALSSNEVAAIHAAGSAGKCEEGQIRMSIRISQVEICWTSQSNAAYALQYRSTLTTNEWLPLLDCIRATNSTTCYYDAILPGQPPRFYRAVLTNCVP